MGRGALPFRGRDTVPWVPAENKAEGAGPVGLLWTPRTGRGAGLGGRGAALEASSGEGLSHNAQWLLCDALWAIVCLCGASRRH